MATQPPNDSIARRTLSGFTGCWKQLLLTDLVYKLIALLVLTPLVGALFRLMVAMSGKTVLADQDILFFFLAPTGWLCLIAIGVLWIGITAAELAALLVVLTAEPGQHVRVVDAIRFASVSVPRFAPVIARILSITLLAVAPFLVAAGVVYAMLLTDHDINYYLRESPPAFQAAVVIGGLIVTLMSAVVLYLATGWLFALPIVLFEDVSPGNVLRVSQQRAVGHRFALTRSIVAWVVVMFVLSSAVTGLTLQLGKLLVSRMSDSLPLLTMTIGLILVGWSGLQLLINLVSMTSFASLHMALYRRPGGGDEAMSGVGAKMSQEVAGGLRLTRRRLLGVLIAGTAFATVTGLLTLRHATSEDSAVIIAHRGASAAAPENTMAAVKQAVSDGADWIEIDVQETADGEVVVFHDSDFMKLAKNPLKIWDATREDLQDIDIGSWFDEKFAGERVPTLTQVLEECQGHAGVVIELKYYGHDQQLEQRVVDIVEATQMTDSVMLMSLKLDAVEKMKALRPDWKTGLLLSVAAGNQDQLDVDFLALNGAFVGRDSISAAHRRGQQIFVWTVNDAVTMSTLIGRGVDGIITDHPDLGRSVLAQRAQMSAGERLLLELAETFGVAPDITEQ